MEPACLMLLLQKPTLTVVSWSAAPFPSMGEPETKVLLLNKASLYQRDIINNLAEFIITEGFFSQGIKLTWGKI